MVPKTTHMQNVGEGKGGGGGTNKEYYGIFQTSLIETPGVAYSDPIVKLEYPLHNYANKVDGTSQCTLAAFICSKVM